MMASWMFYCALCALGLSLAAVLAERVLLAGRGPVRHVWLIAVALSLAVPALAFRFAPRRIVDTEPVASSGVVVEMPVTEGVAPAAPSIGLSQAAPPSVAPARSWRAVLATADQPLAVAWLTLSLALALYSITGVVLLTKARRQWRQQMVNGVSVLVSERTGPALVGAVAPAIVVPEWALALPEDQLSLMLRHEQEHRIARDGQMLFAAQVALIAMPWNVALWWQVMRLRVAVELDCDARVLRSVDARSYGDLLLEVVRPRSGLPPMGVTAFAERATQLERRIRVIAQGRGPALQGTRAVAAIVAVISVSVAWIAPRPPGPDLPAPVVTPAPDPVSSAESTPTAPAAAVPPVAQRDSSRNADRRPAADTATRISVPTIDVTLPPVNTARDSSDTTASRPVRLDTMPMPTGGRGGRGSGMPNVLLADLVYNRLFNGITLTADQEVRPREVIASAARRQAAATDSVQPAWQAFNAALARTRAERDSTLSALLTNDADRATLIARLQPPPGGRRGGGGGPPPPGAGGRGDGRSGRGNTPPDPAQIAETTFLRLFDGITLTPDQQARARAAIARQQADQAALIVPPLPLLLGFRPPNLVVIDQNSDALLMAIITNEADRQTLRSRMVNPSSR